MSDEIMVSEIDPQTAVEWLQNGLVFVDVREKDEVESLAFDIPEAQLIQLPLTEFEEGYKSLPRDKELLLVCSVGQRSFQATAYLVYNGFEKVYNLKRGLLKWLQEGFPYKGDVRTLAVPHQGAGHSCCGGHHDHQGEDGHHTHADGSECCGGKGHGDDSSCCGGHHAHQGEEGHHTHADGSECCGGKGHGDGSNCCGGHHDHQGEEGHHTHADGSECCGGKGHGDDGSCCGKHHH